MNDPAEIIAQLLVNLTLGTSPNSGAWPVYVNKHPNEPSELLCVYTTDGIVEGQNHADKKTTEHPGVQIKVRSTTQPLAYAKAWAIAQALDQVNRNTVTLSSNSYIVQGVARKGTIASTGHDVDDTDWTYALNYTLTVRQSS